MPVLSFKSDADVVKFARKFLDEHVQRFHKDIDICLRPMDDVYRSHAYFPAPACAGSGASGMDALHNDVFRNAKSLSQSREPETSMFVLIPRRMEPEHPAVRLKGHSA